MKLRRMITLLLLVFVLAACGETKPAANQGQTEVESNTSGKEESQAADENSGLEEVETSEEANEGTQDKGLIFDYVLSDGATGTHYTVDRDGMVYTYD